MLRDCHVASGAESHEESEGWRDAIHAPNAVRELRRDYDEGTGLTREQLPELRNIAQVIGGALEMMPPSKYRDVAITAFHDRLVPMIQPTTKEAVSVAQR
jgi:hypothetical protein